MPQVLMIGPSLKVRGGMTSVEEILLNSKNELSRNLIFLPSYEQANKAKKFVLMIKAFIEVVYKLLTIKDIGIIYVHVSHYASFFRKSLFAFVGRVFKKTIIFHMHGSDFDIFYRECPDLIKKYIRYTLSKTTKLIVLTNEWKNFYKSITDDKKIEVVYNSVNVPERNKYNADGCYITYLGMLCNRKGIYDILKVIPDILSGFPDVKFVLAGDGEINKVRSEVQKYASDFSHNIIVPGWIDKQQKNEILEKTVIYLLPSYNEGLPMSVLEAMSYGIPVITTNIGGLSEVIKTDKHGVLISPGDVDELKGSILRLLEDRQIRMDISNCCYNEILNNFNANFFIKRISDIFNTIN